MIIVEMDINDKLTKHDLTHETGHKILHTIGKMEMASPCFGKPYSDEYCMDYLQLPKLKQLSKKINSRIPLERVRTSVKNIEIFLLHMTKHSLKTKPYKNAPIGSLAPKDKYPIENSCKSAINFPSCVITSDGVYIHMHHIRANLQDQFSQDLDPNINQDVYNEYDIPTQAWRREDTPWKAKNCPAETVIGAEIIRMVYENQNVYVKSQFMNQSGDHDYNYCQLMNLKKLCNEVSHQFEIEHPMKYCNVRTLDIERFFHDLKKITLISKGVKVEYLNGTTYYKVHFSRRKRAFAACVITSDAVYLHTRFFLEQQELEKKSKKRHRETSDLHVEDLETRSVLARKRLKGVKEQLRAIQGLSSSLKRQVGIIEESISVCLKEK